jgi:hypothetical protein
MPRPPPASQPRVSLATSRSDGGGGGKALGEVGIVGPAQDQRRQRRRRRRSEDQRHVDDRQAEGEHGIDRQANQRIELRQHDLDPGGGGAVAEPAGDPEAARRVELTLGRQADQQQIGGLLHHQPEGERQPGAVLQRGEIGRQRPAGGPGRQQPDEPARRRDQEGEPDRHRNMRHRQQRCQQAARRGE